MGQGSHASRRRCPVLGLELHHLKDDGSGGMVVDFFTLQSLLHMLDYRSVRMHLPYVPTKLAGLTPL